MNRVGIDIQAGTAFIARAKSDMGRPVVDWLEKIPVEKIAGQEWLKGCCPVWSVNDNLVQVKNLNMQLGSDINFRTAGKLELSTCLLEPEIEFLFSIYQTGLAETYIGTVCRLKELVRLVELVGLAPKDGYTSDNFIVRSAALGSGFATYCQGEPGELIGLIDIGLQTAAISLMYKGKSISLAYMPLSESLADETNQFKQLAVQAKTMINFQISRLSGAGLNVPLATLVLSGAQVNQATCDLFLEQFPSGVKLPVINRALLSDSLGEQNDVGQYLIAMGLACNSLAR